MKILRGRKVIGVLGEFTAIKTRDHVLREIFRQACEVGVRVNIGAVGPQGEIVDGYEIKTDPSPCIVRIFSQSKH